MCFLQVSPRLSCLSWTILLLHHLVQLVQDLYFKSNGQSCSRSLSQQPPREASAPLSSPTYRKNICDRPECVRIIVREDYVYISSPNKYPKNIPLSSPKDRSVICSRQLFSEAGCGRVLSRVLCIYCKSQQPAQEFSGIISFPTDITWNYAEKHCAGEGSRISMVWDINHAQGLRMYCKSQQPAQ